jgi:uncharacterized membrane protein
MTKFKTVVLRLIKLHLISATIFGFIAGYAQSVETSSPAIRAVLFFSPTCQHCVYVKEEVLPPLIARYGSRLQIALVNTTTQTGHELFLTACMKHGLLRLSVPLLIVGNTAMVGSDEIPQKFPDLIEKHLEAGGVDWPNIAGLSAMLAANPASSAETSQLSQPPVAETPAVPIESAASNAKSSSTPSPALPAMAIEGATIPNKAPEPHTTAVEPNSKPSQAPSSGLSKRGSMGQAQKYPDTASIPQAPASETSNAGTTHPPSAIRTEPSGIIDLTAGEAEMGMIDRLKRDIYGNGLAIFVLAGMVMTILLSPVILRKSAIPTTPEMKPRYDWLIPILALAGLGVAAYLSNVEVRQVEAVCGPIGDCNTVNQSRYSRLFGVLPIGVLGLFGFLAILTAWGLRRWGSGKISLWASVGILGMTAFGTFFSIYLTFLEPFVIGATCLWCLSSAVIMTSLFVLALKPGRQAWSTLS